MTDAINRDKSHNVDFNFYIDSSSEQLMKRSRENREFIVVGFDLLKSTSAMGTTIFFESSVSHARREI
jgi:hypothetical protein